MRNKLYRLGTLLGARALLRSSKQGKVTILSLHRVSPERDPFFDPIHPDRFDALVKYCTKHYSVTTFAGLAEKSKKPKLILSFDDGYQDYMEYALPILHKYKAGANHNLVNSCLNDGTTIWTQQLNDVLALLKSTNQPAPPTLVDLVGSKPDGQSWSQYKSKVMQVLFKLPTAQRAPIMAELLSRYPPEKQYRMMTWEDARQAMNAGTEIGSHTYHHPSLLGVTSADELQLEIGRSVEELSEKLGTPVRIIAFPNGQHHPGTVDYCGKIDLRHALLVGNRLNKDQVLSLGLNMHYRINMVNEPEDAMLLRVENLHSRLKSLRGK